MTLPVTMIEREYPSFSTMIRQLFKLMGSTALSMHHAATGIAGECSELAGANSRKNIIEESSDLEFYIEALKQQFEFDLAGAFIGAQIITDSRANNIHLGNVFSNIQSLGGDILDQSKKVWVYSKPLDAATMARMLLILEKNLEFVYELIGTDRASVIHFNQIKLIGPGGRFESGFYSDSAAIARADKVE